MASAKENIQELICSDEQAAIKEINEPSVVPRLQIPL